MPRLLTSQEVAAAWGSEKVLIEMDKEEARQRSIELHHGLGLPQLVARIPDHVVVRAIASADTESCFGVDTLKLQLNGEGSSATPLPYVPLGDRLDRLGEDALLVVAMLPHDAKRKALRQDAGRASVTTWSGGTIVEWILGGFLRTVHHRFGSTSTAAEVTSSTSICQRRWSSSTDWVSNSARESF